jgi:hypothetical protein
MVALGDIWTRLARMRERWDVQAEFLANHPTPGDGGSTHSWLVTLRDRRGGEPARFADESLLEALYRAVLAAESAEEPEIIRPLPDREPQPMA